MVCIGDGDTPGAGQGALSQSFRGPVEAAQGGQLEAVLFGRGLWGRRAGSAFGNDYVSG